MNQINVEPVDYYRKKADVLAAKLSQALDEITQLELYIEQIESQDADVSENTEDS